VIVSLFGLGYVGVVTGGCLADLGHEVIGVDVLQPKVDAINEGLSPIVEPELDGLLMKGRRTGRLRATTQPAEALQVSQVSLVCVGTPGLESGRPNLASVRHVSRQIREGLIASGKPHVLIYRSTLLPGTLRVLVREYFEDLHETGLLRVYYSPEFLREGSAVADFREPSLSVIGTHDGRSPETTEPEALLGPDPAILSWEGAEMVKYACNYYHALKIGYANEIGRLCKFIGEDATRVMDVVCSDRKLNVSARYLRPGNAFGGSCLPKDLNALKSFARQEGVVLPLLESTLDTNQAHLDQLIKQVIGKERQRIGLLGLAFKSNTDDLRGSPMVALAETLLGRGYELRIYDPQLELGRLIGSNASESRRRMPHLASLLRPSPCDVVAESDVVVASQWVVSAAELATVARADQYLIDLHGWEELRALPWRYEGICW
jgi:GDP-mannose 6-dehydrogenase